MRVLGMVLGVVLLAVSAFAAEVPLASLKKGDVVEGFRTDALYLNGSGDVIGGRFIHERSGFTLDYLQIESVPQGYTWVNSIPVSDQGEPHTQEHLLLGKGTTGNNLGAPQTSVTGTAPASHGNAVDTPAANAATQSLSNTDTGILKK